MLSMLSAKPVVTDEEMTAALVMVHNARPERDITADTVGIVLETVGRCVVGGYVIPSDLIRWLGTVPNGILIFTYVALETLASNIGIAIRQDRMLWCIYALTGYKWVFGHEDQTPTNRKGLGTL